MGKLRYFKNLDALRAFAAIAVIVAHYFDASRMGEGSRIAKISLLGNSGVSLFFVLSGFVITRILINSTQSSGYFSSFYIRRTLRIFPLYYFSLLCYWYLPGLINKTTAMHSFSAADFYFVFYLQNFARTFNWIQTGPGHFWSLAVEEHFYLIWPAVVYFALKKNLQLLTWLSIAIIIVIHLVRVLMFKDGYNINFFTFTRLDQLVMGGLIAIIERKGYLDEKFRKQYFALFIAGLFGVAFIEFQNDPLIKEVFKHTAFGLLYAGMIMIAASNQKNILINKILQNNIIQYLGKVSYGIYVWHVISIYIIDYYFSLSPLYGFFLNLVFTVVLSWFSYSFIEKPFLQLKSKFEYNR